MITSVNELHRCEVAGQEYWFRTPTVYDLPRMRRSLALQGIRRPLPIEFRVAAVAGIEALGAAAGDAAETARQRALIEEWYALLEPLGEDDIDEPDFEKRAAELDARLAERDAARQQIYPQVAAIEATLSRHWPPYRELVADRRYWDDVSAIDVVRLLLVRRADASLPRDADGLLTDEAYLGLLADHRSALATFATALVSPTETERKN